VNLGLKSAIHFQINFPNGLCKCLNGALDSRLIQCSDRAVAITLVVEMGVRLVLAEIVENSDALMCPRGMKHAVMHPLIESI